MQQVTLSKFFDIFNSKQKINLFKVFLIIFSVSVLEIAGLTLLIPFIDIFINTASYIDLKNQYPYLFHFFEFTNNYKINISILFLIFYLFKTIILSFLLYFQFKILNNLQGELSQKIYNNFLSQKFEILSKVDSSNFIRYITYDVARFTESLKYSALVLSESLLIIGILITLFVINSYSLLLFVVMLVPIFFTFQIIKGRIQIWSEKLQSIENKVIQSLQQGLGGIKEIRVFQKFNLFKVKFAEVVIDKAYYTSLREFILQSPRYLIELIMITSGVIVLLIIGTSSNLINNLPFIIFLGAVVVRMLPMSNRLLLSISSIRSIYPSIRIVYNQVRQNELISKRQHNHEIKINDFNSIVAENISFQYSKDENLIKDLNFEIYKGESIGIIGFTGSGKSTLINLLLGLITPSQGSIFINKKKLEDVHNHWLGKIGYVSQDIFLLNDTIKENIIFGSNINIEKLNHIIKLAELNEWIETLTEGLETEVGERGLAISGGQKQRIGIARALYKSPEVLIFDEATSALDNNTQSKIVENLESFKKTLTTITIAHRIETIKNCSRIFIIKNGNIVTSGTFNELKKSSKYFQQLNNIK